jgi:putative restriction endonuclease
MATLATDWLARVAAIKQWAQGDTRAPHKPLLILYGIGRLLRFGASQVTFREAEEPLKRLIDTYGPPGSRPTPHYPFRRLENDGLWEVRIVDGTGDPGERVGDLRRAAEGRFNPDFEQALTDPATRAAIVGFLLDEHFAPSLHDDLLEDAGIDAVELYSPTIERRTERRRRDPAFRSEVMAAYEYRCAFCGYDGRLESTTVGLDAAHVRWHALGGPDAINNGLSLCTIHHKLFDQGAMGLDPDRRILVSRQFVGRGNAAEKWVLALAGAPLTGPQPGDPPPAPEHIAWHTTQVFRGPARVA